MTNDNKFNNKIPRVDYIIQCITVEQLCSTTKGEKMINRHKLATILGIIAVVFFLYSYFLVEKNNNLLIPFVVCLSIVLNNLFNKK